MQPTAPNRAHIRSRILEKLSALGQDGPDRLAALNVFFDLSLEYDSLRDFKTLCVLVPDICLSTPASLYLRDTRGRLRLRRTTSAQGQKALTLPDPPCPDDPGIVRQDGGAIVGICDAEHDPALLGVLCLHRPVAPEDDGFWLEYARWTARIMAVKQASVSNRKRLTFINNLMRDIGHNVIVPNIQFKLFFLQMERHLALMESRIGELVPARPDAPDREARRELPFLARDVRVLQQAISRRFQQSSLFLESLLRRSHFEKGNYDLVLKPCKFKSQIIEPQLERFRPMLRAQGIRIEIDPDVRIDEDIQLQADLGLISQVFANLLANAVKYTQPMPVPGETDAKILRYGWESLTEAFGPGKPGVRLFVATSGPEVPPGEQSRLFEEGFRSSGTDSIDGTGHGLSFVKQIVELHKGRVGYAYDAPMNVFSVLLRRPQDAADTTEAGSCPSPS